ncbi:leucine-rich repeat neuronal protein 3-like [Hetaerina americana]|uniref:leucine-rich repeat neuronal protein 3-like n=1 Tax=Hetaerina americana TaxID=62018 RepID=UPI003A7F2742
MAEADALTPEISLHALYREIRAVNAEPCRHKLNLYKMAPRSASLGLLSMLLLASATADYICDRCKCQRPNAVDGVTTMAIDCTIQNVNDVYPIAESWPHQLKENVTPPVLIDVLFSHEQMTRLHPLPAVPIVKFASPNCQLATIDDGAFSGPSPTIEEIDLSSNRLTSSLQPDAFRGPYSPSSLQPLPKVRVLNLKRNAFHSLNSDLFEHFPALEELYLDQNPFKVIDIVTVKAIATIIKLKVLSLADTNIHTLPNTFLHTPRFLEYLDLSDNHMDTVPKTVGDAKQLKTLILDGNPIRTFHNLSLPLMPKLSKLSISRMPHLVAIEDGAFSGLTALEEFHCQLNPNLELIDTYAMGENLTDKTIELKTLILNNNRLSYLSRHLVLYWNHLEKVTLYGNPWNCDCVNQWMVTDLLPILDGIDPNMSKTMKCYKPPELLGKSMYDMQMHFPHLRCLDLYANRPENDGSMLVGVLIGSLLAIPITACLYFLWTKRNQILASCFPGAASSTHEGTGAADFSRRFYKRTQLSQSGEF